MKIFKSIMLAGVAFAPSAVFAHAGHGHENPLSPAHYLGNPEHAIPLALAAVVVAFLIGRKLLQPTSKKAERK